ncbi:ankyrin repeat domain-containing protein [Mucilaginibacter sp. UR6-1]|uniref:ankyrin repeat domain-containing protein n=1 Tax=Mucilaginibacter sp. UR6-1 TaxID=1435643 RepID=UPI001E39D650|nr:ankyrin repeat domain-containing protein [Mucilaginibacter sp. UR6-1]MCC8408307.1 ankyrin repeat domain-containing protein [Mucilaginibacter sp. UR6-1]
MKKKEIKEYFKAISFGDLLKVSSLIEADRDYINVCNYSPPKKDDGQSGLQLAFKTGNFAIAKLLIRNGADVNFIEISTINEWRAPVLHDCIRAVIFNSYTLQKDTTKFDEALSLLKLMLAQQANPNSFDSYSNNCLHRAILDSRQMIDHPATDLKNGMLLDQLRSVFDSLISAGADINQVTDNRPSAMSLVTNFKMEKYELF